MNRKRERNKVGFNMLLWSALISEELNPLAEKLKEIGYDGVEVPMAEEKRSRYVDFGRFAREIGLGVTAVLALSPDADPIHESAAVRERAVERLKWSVDRADDLGAKNVCGPFHSAFGHFRKRPPTHDEYMRSAEVLYKAAEYAAKSQVVLTPEAINRFECYLCNTIDQLSKLISLTDHCNLKPMFDTHHAHIEEKGFTSTIKSLGGKLGHVHISESDRGTPGSAQVRWDEVFSSLADIDYRGWLTIEAFSRRDETFANSINVWREYNQPWDIATNGYTFIRKMQDKYGALNRRQFVL